MTQFFKSPRIPTLPAPKIPDAPAPGPVTDTGASIVIGSTDVKNQRVSGRSAARKKTTGTDVLGGLGSSGLNI